MPYSLIMIFMFPQFTLVIESNSQALHVADWALFNSAPLNLFTNRKELQKSV